MLCHAVLSYAVPCCPSNACSMQHPLKTHPFTQVLNLESKCADLQINITALREEISERESVIAQNYTTIQLLRRRLADIEKHKFVLGYRTQVPARETNSDEQDGAITIARHNDCTATCLTGIGKMFAHQNCMSCMGFTQSRFELETQRIFHARCRLPDT